MKRRHAPWWLYVVAASFCCYFALTLYLEFRGPEIVGIVPDFSKGGMVLRWVSPDSPGARAGLQSGDRVLAAEGQPVHTLYDWLVMRANFEVGKPRRLEIERGDKRLEVVVTLERKIWSQNDRPHQLNSIALYAPLLVCLLLGLIVAFSRPHDSTALVGAWLLASATSGVADNYGFAAAWRHLPALLGALLWIAFLSGRVAAPLCFTFFALFPRRLFRSLWPLRVVWVVGIGAAVPSFLFTYRMVYQPEHAIGSSQIASWAPALLENLYFLGGLIVLVVNYRRLDDRNERRRVRVLVLGTVMGVLGRLPVLIIGELFPSFTVAFFSTPAPMVSNILFLLAPVSFAYALLRHRLFDIRLMLRQGLQYALARGFVLSTVPLLATILLLDVWLHADEPLSSILRAHGWVYASFVVLAILARLKRRSWLESLDRRFFRERYNAQRLLREVVEDIRAEQRFERVAPGVVGRIEAALHPEFVELLMREPREVAYHILAAAPAAHERATLPAESKLLALVRLLGKPLEVPRKESGWLQQQLPHEETEFLLRARIDLVVPVATLLDRAESLLVLGSKRSEEPYSGEDLELLAAIAASLALLFERQQVAAAVARSDIFEECPECGACYDTGITRCALDSAALVPVALPRLLEGRYRVDRHLGRGGMGTVYEAADTALGRRVAVKVIRDDLVGSAEATERFRREARAVATFAHPNVVTVYDFGLAVGRRAFLVMELLYGATLRVRLRKETRLTPSHTLAIMRGVCAAIEAAHRRQLIHRDLKPENIFLVCSDSQEIAKVLDFGLAKFILSTKEEVTVDTATGMLIGTLPYMSPEQLRGEAASPAWDLWALAVVAYEMLTGKHPFAAASRFELERAITAGEASPLAAYLPGTRPNWQEFFDRALARDSARRPDSPGSFFSELESKLQ